jgi:hypothetical protein
MALDPNDPSYFQKLGALTSQEGQVRGDRIAFQKLHPWGSQESAHPGLGGEIGHVLGKIGNIAGGILAPEEMGLIGGTDLNRGMQQTQAMGQIQEGSDIALKGAQAQEARAKGVPVQKLAGEVLNDGKGGFYKVNETNGLPVPTDNIGNPLHKTPDGQPAAAGTPATATQGASAPTGAQATPTGVQTAPTGAQPAPTGAQPAPATAGPAPAGTKVGEETNLADTRKINADNRTSAEGIAAANRTGSEAIAAANRTSAEKIAAGVHADAEKNIAVNRGLESVQWKDPKTGEPRTGSYNEIPPGAENTARKVSAEDDAKNRMVYAQFGRWQENIGNAADTMKAWDNPKDKEQAIRAMHDIENSWSAGLFHTGVDLNESALESAFLRSDNYKAMSPLGQQHMQNMYQLWSDAINLMKTETGGVPRGEHFLKLESAIMPQPEKTQPQNHAALQAFSRRILDDTKGHARPTDMPSVVPYDNQGTFKDKAGNTTGYVDADGKRHNL